MCLLPKEWPENSGISGHAFYERVAGPFGIWEILVHNVHTCSHLPSSHPLRGSPCVAECNQPWARSDKGCKSIVWSHVCNVGIPWQHFEPDGGKLGLPEYRLKSIDFTVCKSMKLSHSQGGENGHSAIAHTG